MNTNTDIELYNCRNAKRRSSHFASYPKYYLSNVYLRLVKFSFAFNFVNVFNFGSSVCVKIHVPNKDYVSNMILTLPMVCKHTALEICKLVYENFVWLANLMASVQRKYAENEEGKEAQKQQKRHQEQERNSGGKSQQTHNQQQQHGGRLTNYVRSLKWTPIPVGVGFALLAYQHYQRVMRRSRDPNHATNIRLAREWEVTCYRMMPLRAFSRAWGWVHSINLPVWARSPLYSWYAEAFKCNIGEAEIEDLQHYKNLGEFFRRGLKSGVRPVCYRSPVVSPVDGTVLHCGKVECGNVEQVKGVSYSLPTFLGPQTWYNNNNNNNSQSVDKTEYSTALLKNKNNCLYHCVIYLAPGDYHRFHSPVQWTVQFRRHFAGELLSVNPVVARWISGLFSLNERAVYVGEWEHGFFSYTAVGATNVGSIKVYKDEELMTNSWKLKKNTFVDKKFDKPISLEKGDNFGEFNLGSTIVLLFEAPPDFQFSGECGSKIFLGQSLYKNKEYESSPENPKAEANPSL